MTFSISPQDLDLITDVDIAFGSTRFLPPMESIPDEFHEDANVYNAFINTVACGRDLDKFVVEELPAAVGKREKLARLYRSHLASFSPKHEHKIAGLAYVTSLFYKVSYA